MANSLKVQLQATYSDGTQSQAFAPKQLSVVPTNFSPGGGMWTVGSTAEAMPVGDVTAPKMVFMVNLSASVVVDIGYDNSGTVGPFNLPAGGTWFCCIPIKSGDTVYGKTASGTAKIMYMLTDA